jgi:hypothetical protein
MYKRTKLEGAGDFFLKLKRVLSVGCLLCFVVKLNMNMEKPNNNNADADAD